MLKVTFEREINYLPPTQRCHRVLADIADSSLDRSPRRLRLPIFLNPRDAIIALLLKHSSLKFKSVIISKKVVCACSYKKYELTVINASFVLSTSKLANRYSGLCWYGFSVALNYVLNNRQANSISKSHN